MIPVSIDNNFYDADNFVACINSEYKKISIETDKIYYPKLFHQYINRNSYSLPLKLSLGITYNRVKPAIFNGLIIWERMFLNYIKKYRKNISPNSYLENILVKKLNIFIKEKLHQQPVVCYSYRDYILSCISYNYVPKLNLSWSNQRGWGVYAKEDIHPYMFIGLYTGKIVFNFLSSIYEKIRGYRNKYLMALAYNDEYVIDGETSGNYTRFINHDDKKNDRIGTFCLQIASNDDIISIPHRGFIAKHTNDNIITSFCDGEEIVWDYGPSYYFDW